jgi:hypothetical protein
MLGYLVGRDRQMGPLQGTTAYGKRINTFGQNFIIRTRDDYSTSGPELLQRERERKSNRSSAASKRDDAKNATFVSQESVSQPSMKALAFSP